MKKRYIVFVLVLCMMMAAAAACAMESSQVEQKAVISGTVAQTIAVGSQVKSGDSLVDISTLTGTSSAARATLDGTVSQVLVKPGDQVSPGQAVAYIQP